VKSVVVGLVLVVVTLAAGCAAKREPLPFTGKVDSRSTNIPLQGMPSVPRFTADTGPLRLANFSDEAKRDAQRSARMTSQALHDMEKAAATPLGAICVVFPPSCVGVLAFGALGANLASVTQIPQEQADQLAAIVGRENASSHLVNILSTSLPSGAQPFPRIVMGPVTVILVPTSDAVAFRVLAQAQGFPAADDAPWKPSMHLISLPPRSLDEWLADDGRQLTNDLQAAVGVIAQDVCRTYAPFEARKACR